MSQQSTSKKVTADTSNSSLRLPIMDDLSNVIFLSSHVEALSTLLTEFRDIATLSSELLRRTNLTDHHITILPRINPISQPPYELPLS